MDNNKGQLIVTHGKSHPYASRDTLSTWMKVELKLTGLDVNTVTTHCCRLALASASKAKQVIT